MSKTRKYFWRVFILLLILIAVAATVVVMNLGRIVKSGVEVYGPRITKVSVTVDQVNIGLLTASAEVKNLVVGNPSGYKSPQAISVGDVSVGVDPSTIFSDKIVVRSINIQYPQITFEGSLGGNNLSAILANVDSTSKTGGTATTNASVPSGPANPSRKFEVDDLVITGAKVSGSLNLFGREVGINELPLPDIHLSNLGTGPDGITAADLTSRVFHAITTATITAVTSKATGLEGNAKGLGTKGANSVKKTFNSLFGK